MMAPRLNADDQRSAPGEVYTEPGTAPILATSVIWHSFVVVYLHIHGSPGAPLETGPILVRLIVWGWLLFPCLWLVLRGRQNAETALFLVSSSCFSAYEWWKGDERSLVSSGVSLFVAMLFFWFWARVVRQRAAWRAIGPGGRLASSLFRHARLAALAAYFVAVWLAFPLLLLHYAHYLHDRGHPILYLRREDAYQHAFLRRMETELGRHGVIIGLAKPLASMRMRADAQQYNHVVIDTESATNWKPWVRTELSRCDVVLLDVTNARLAASPGPLAPAGEGIRWEIDEVKSRFARGLLSAAQILVIQPRGEPGFDFDPQIRCIHYERSAAGLTQLLEDVGRWLKARARPDA